MVIRVTGQSMNGQQQYSIDVDVQLPEAAQELLRAYVIQHVRDVYGITPDGVPWPIDTRTIRTERVPS